MRPILDAGDLPILCHRRRSSDPLVSRRSGAGRLEYGRDRSGLGPAAHNAAFEDAIARHILHPQHGFPLIPLERQRCTQAVALSLGYPAKLETLADALKLKYRKDDAGKRLMLMMAKPRKPLDHEDPNGLYWHEEPDQIDRLSDYNCTDVEVEREADTRLGNCPTPSSGSGRSPT